MATGGRDDPRVANGVLKTGTAVPNRIFVGGLSANTKEEDLRILFSKYGNVKATKIIVDKTGNSKGYGFVTFETEEEAQKVLTEVDCPMLKDRKLNIAPAVKKQHFSRALESNSIHGAPVVWSAQPYSGHAGFSNRESLYYPQAAWPLVWPQQLYVPQQPPFPPNHQTGYPQYVYSVAPPDYPYPPVGPVSGSDFSETSSADSVESVKTRPKQTASTPVPEYDRNRPAQPKTSLAPPVSVQRYSSGNMESSPTYVHSPPFPHLHHHVLAKTVNGVTVMAYPSSFVMGSPAIVHVKDGSNEPESMLTEFGFLHSPIASGALTPPPTPISSLSCDFNVNTSIESVRKN